MYYKVWSVFFNQETGCVTYKLKVLVTVIDSNDVMASDRECIIPNLYGSVDKRQVSEIYAVNIY